MKKLLAIAALAALLAPEACAPAYAGQCWGLRPLCPPMQVPVCVCSPAGQCVWLCGGD